MNEVKLCWLPTSNHQQTKMLFSIFLAHDWVFFEKWSLATFSRLWDKFPWKVHNLLYLPLVNQPHWISIEAGVIVWQTGNYKSAVAAYGFPSTQFTFKVGLKLDCFSFRCSREVKTCQVFILNSENWPNGFGTYPYYHLYVTLNTMQNLKESHVQVVHPIFWAQYCL